MVEQRDEFCARKLVRTVESRQLCRKEGHRKDDVVVFILRRGIQVCPVLKRRLWSRFGRAVGYKRRRRFFSRTLLARLRLGTCIFVGRYLALVVRKDDFDLCSFFTEFLKPDEAVGEKNEDSLGPCRSLHEQDVLHLLA